MTGQLIAPSKLMELFTNYQIKPIIGSGLTFENIPDVIPYLSGAIVGTAIKKDPTNLSTPVDPGKAKSIAQRWKSMKNEGNDILDNNQPL
jgi:predicted TIM-barrel enzyme